MIERKWVRFNDRVKYVVEHAPTPNEAVAYICLDGKFHSWIGREKHWVIRTVDDPANPIKLVNTFYNWMTEISR